MRQTPVGGTEGAEAEDMGGGCRLLMDLGRPWLSRGCFLKIEGTNQRSDRRKQAGSINRKINPLLLSGRAIELSSPSQEHLYQLTFDFSLRSPLIRGHGNFGSIDADPAAAMCYTECRLEALTEAMLLADLEQDTVDFVPNFDNSQKEPSLLPVRIPNLLLNGSSGIAVGMATNIPPHNLGELVDALSVLIHDPDATLQELLEYMPGPDFPTGGIIIGNIGILDAYRTGRGRVVVRGKTDIELLDPKSKRLAIIIKEIPYQTNKASRVEKIAELVENKNLEGISDIRDESDRSGMRIVIEIRNILNTRMAATDSVLGFAWNKEFRCNINLLLSTLATHVRFKLVEG